MQQIALAEPDADEDSREHQEACIPGGASHSTHHTSPGINAAGGEQLWRKLSTCWLVVVHLDLTGCQ